MTATATRSSSGSSPEAAAFYLAGTAVTARLCRKRVMEVRLVNQESGPGTVRLLHQICTEAEARRADLNRAADRARLEVAVHILTSGACAAELASGTAWNPNDSSLQFAA